MEGEDQKSEDSRSFSNANIPKRIAIVIAGASVNIIFGLLVYFILMLVISNGINENKLAFAWNQTGEFIISIGDSIKQLFTGNVGIDQLMGPIGISGMVAKTTGIKEFVYMLSLISVSLGVTNLLPIPALDGGKIVLLVLEAIRKKPLKERTEANLQMLGFISIIALSVFVAYNDIFGR